MGAGLRPEARAQGARRGGLRPEKPAGASCTLLALETCARHPW